jgi:hypothetical protein
MLGIGSLAGTPVCLRSTRVRLNEDLGSAEQRAPESQRLAPVPSI